MTCHSFCLFSSAMDALVQRSPSGEGSLGFFLMHELEVPLLSNKMQGQACELS